MTEANLPVLFQHQIDPEAIRMAAFGPRDREAVEELILRLDAKDRRGNST